MSEPRSGAAPRSCPILMLNYGGWADTMAGLAAMASDRARIWLIDNASPEDRTAEVASAFPEVRIVRMERNWGWAGAYNRAIAMAARDGNDAVYILNNDAVLHPDTVAAALASLFADPRLAAVGSLMLQDGGDTVFFDGEWHFHNAVRRASDAHRELRAVRSVHGGGFALKLAAFDDVGPFHEDYFLYHEETDWCLRARDKGWGIAIDGRSRVDHEGRASNTGFNTNYYMARNRFLAMRRGVALRDVAETPLSIAEYEYIEARAAGLAQRVAITNGLLDGWRGRFGPRTATWPGVVTVPLAALAPTAFRLKRKLAHLLRR